MAHSPAQPTQRKVPFFDYPALYRANASKIQDVITDVLRRGAFILQRDVSDLEKTLSDFVGCKHAVGVANCTDALQLALMACGIQEGDEVILPSHTFVASAGAVHAAGGVPVPIDCGDDHLVDPTAIEKAVSHRTRFVMPVQLNGRVAAMDLITTIAEEHDLTIVEDAAQALGARYKGRQAGSFGRAAAFSFYPAKLLGCFGDGGMIVTDDDEVAQTLRILRDQGRDESGRIVQWGMNSRLDNLQAAILNEQFRHYSKSIEKRRAIASEYDRGLSDVPGLALPPGPDSDPNRYDVYQNYEIEAERRDELKRYLSECGVGTIIQWGGQPVHSIDGLGFNVTLPRTERLFEKCLLLPMNTYLSDEDVSHVIFSVRRFYGKA